MGRFEIDLYCTELTITTTDRRNNKFKLSQVSLSFVAGLRVTLYLNSSAFKFSVIYRLWPNTRFLLSSLVMLTHSPNVHRGKMKFNTLALSDVFKVNVIIIEEEQ